MRFDVLGPLQVTVGSDHLRIRSRMEGALLAVLVSRANEVVPASVLAEALWRDRVPKNVGNALQIIVHRLRRRLGDSFRIHHRNPGYSLITEAGEVDLLRFEQMVAEALRIQESGEPTEAARMLRTALALWRGDPYSDFCDIPFLYPETARLRERRLTVTEQLIGIELRAGNHDSVAAELPVLIAENPLREVFYAQLMRALYGCQRQADALQVYQQARRALNEMGLVPSAELRELQSAVLRGTMGVHERVVIPVPAQLPPTATAFTGRRDHLRQLDELLSQDADATHVPIAVITGPAGVGKTTLALRWAHRVRDRFPDGQLYVDLQGCSAAGELRPDVVLGRFLRALGVTPEHVPAHLAEASAMFRSFVAGRRLLILLDNASHPDQVRPLLPAGAVLLRGGDQPRSDDRSHRTRRRTPARGESLATGGLRAVADQAPRQPRRPPPAR